MEKVERARLAKYRAQVQALIEGLDDLQAYLLVEDTTKTPVINREEVLARVRETICNARDEGQAAYLTEYGASNMDLARGCK